MEKLSIGSDPGLTPALIKSIIVFFKGIENEIENFKHKVMRKGFLRDATISYLKDTAQLSTKEATEALEHYLSSK